MTTPQSAQNAQPPPTASNGQQSISSSVVLRSLSILLGFFFIFIGAMKITPQLSKDLHKDLVSICDSYKVLVNDLNWPDKNLLFM